jgi:hypothetical protein
VKPPLKRSRSAPDGGDEETQEQLQDQIAESGSIEEEEKTDNATLLRLLEEGEKVLPLGTECPKTGWRREGRMECA